MALPRSNSESIGPTDATFDVCGVYFRYGNAGLDWLKTYHLGWMPLHNELRESIRWVADRQKRHYYAYWDVLTWLGGAERPKRFNRSDNPELTLLDNLADALAKDRLNGELIKELTRVKAIGDVEVRANWYNAARQFQEGLVVTRTNPARLVRNAKGDLQKVQSGLFRTFTVDMGDAGGTLGNVSFDQLLILSVLLQVRLDLETFYETGHMRLARCRHKDCRAWFIRKPMGQKQRFCSDVCRALSHRKQRSSAMK